MKAGLFVFSLLFVGISAKSCLEQVQELATSPMLMGAFKPVCQSNGMFAETQFHEGYYFCVKPETGEELLGTRVRFTKPKSCKLTPCFMQRHDGLLKTQSKMVGHFTPQCEADGSFKNVQCHGSTGFCYCVGPDTGVKVEGTEVRGMPTCVNDVKLCLKQVKDLEAKPKLLGAFKPVCQDSGMFNEMQCHASYCYCVVPETGEELMGTRVRFTKPKSCKATPCLMQRHGGLLKSKSMMVGHFTPKCEEDGSFKTIQCHGSTGFCFCVAPETGAKVEGTEVRGMPNCKSSVVKATTDCLKQVKDLEAKPKLLGAFKPICQDNGMFAETQCHASYCYCVKPETGEELMGTRVRFTKPKSCKLTPCVLQRHHSMKDSARGMVGQFTPQCEADGSFTKTQCHSSTGFCFCVMPATGEKLLGTELRFRKPTNCELTDCIKQRHMAMKSKLLGVFRPTCEENGAYAATQCKEGICYCAFPMSGAEVMGTRMQRGQKPVSCELTKCLTKRHDLLSKPLMLGARKVECTDDGKFNPIQCNEGMCNCVFPETGEEILGTMVRFSKPSSCKLTACVMARHKGWKMARLGLLGVPISRCSPNGDYQKVQCRNGMCWCVDPKSGKAVAGQSFQWTVPNCV